jgi:hypothetical protein
MFNRIVIFAFLTAAFSAGAITPEQRRDCVRRVSEGQVLSVELDGKNYDLYFAKPRSSFDRFSSVEVVDRATNAAVPLATLPDGAKLMLSGGQYLVINHPNWVDADDYYYAYGSDFVRFDASDIEFAPKDGTSVLHGHLLSAGATGSAYLIEEGEGTHDVLKRYHRRMRGKNVRPQLLLDYSALKSLNERKEDNDPGFQIIEAELVEYETESPFQNTGLEPMLRLPFVKGRSVHDIVGDKSVSEEKRVQIAELYRRKLYRFGDFLRLIFPDGTQLMDTTARGNLFRDGKADGLPMIQGRVSEKVRTSEIPEELKEFYSDPLNEEVLIHRDGTTVISHPLIIKTDNVFVDLADPELTMTLIDPF